MMAWRSIDLVRRKQAGGRTIRLVVTLVDLICGGRYVSLAP